MSEEAIQKGRFGEASDVWAFGVLGWEVLTLGNIPYFEITDDQKLIAFVTGGGRLSRAQVSCECPDALWSLLQRCWSKKATDRPTFSSLVPALRTIKDEAAASKIDQMQQMQQALQQLHVQPGGGGVMRRRRRGAEGALAVVFG